MTAIADETTTNTRSKPGKPKGHAKTVGTATLIRKARTVCNSLGTVLHRSLQNMAHDPPSTASEVDGLMKLVTAYQKALSTVLDFEKTLEKIARDGAGESGEAIDHDSARREILGRLAQLAGEA
ncbi:MAG: hypothetical protein AAGI51_04790 [Pseudomonadota bacterium]